MKEYNRKKWLECFGLVLLVTAMMVMMVSCTVSSTNNTDVLVKNTSTSQPEEIVEDNAGITMATQYFQFLYPDFYQDSVVLKVSENGSTSKLIAVATINESDIELFTLSLSTEVEDGYKIGSLRDERVGDIGIYIIMNERKEQDFPEDEYEKFSRLQEIVNDFLVQLAQDERFVRE